MIEFEELREQLTGKRVTVKTMPWGDQVIKVLPDNVIDGDVAVKEIEARNAED